VKLRKQYVIIVVAATSFQNMVHQVVFADAVIQVIRQLE
jgi:hypothetical protein